MSHRLTLLCLFGVAACGKPDETDPCANNPYDGPAPEPQGDYTATAYNETWTNDCDQNTPQYAWLDSPFNIDGYTPNGLDIHFADNSSLSGVLTDDGGLMFSGKRTDLPEAAAVYITLSGLLYKDSGLSGRAKWSAFAMIGYDTDGDGQVECRAFGDVTAIHSDGN